MSASFVSTYSQLIDLSPEAPADKFYSPEEYYKLESLGPSLPKLKYPIPSLDTDSSAKKSIEVVLKSIRPPYKFSTTLADVSLSQTVYGVKTHVVESVETLRSAGVTALDLKFMIKSKVLTDTTALSSLVLLEPQLAITVMVSAPAAPKPSADVTMKDAEDDPVVSAPPAISSATWVKIEQALAADLGAPEAAKVLARFKSTV